MKKRVLNSISLAASIVLVVMILPFIDSDSIGHILVCLCCIIMIAGQIYILIDELHEKEASEAPPAETEEGK